MVCFLVFYGILQLNKLPIDAVPDITNNQVQILTSSPSYAAQDIERMINFPIEQACSNIDGVKEIRSFARFGLSVITVIFEDDIDIYWARQQIAERLQKIQDEIPIEIGKPELAPITTGLGEIYQYVVRPQKGYENHYTLDELRDIQDWIVRRQLLGVKGVADVSSFGGKLRQYEISINPHQLQAYQINIIDIMRALENNNQNTGSAYIEKNSTAFFIRTDGIIKSISDIENIVIKTTENNIPVQIKDVAKVKYGYAVRYGSLLYTSQQGKVQYETAGGIVMMLKGENSNEVVQRVKEKIQEIQQTLPEGVVIEPFLDRTKMVNSTIQTVIKNLFEGALIVITIIILFLGNIRYGFLVASVIPLSVLFAVIMMNLFQVSGNLMSLGALDFGLIVDGAIIIVETIVSRLSFNSIDKNPLYINNLVYQSTSKMINSAVLGQVIILIVYLPILYFTGIEGKMFRPMAQTVMFALLGAFILSVTYIPVMSSWLARSNKIKHFHISDKIMDYIGNAYIKLFKIFFRQSKRAFIALIVLFVTSIYILIHLGGEFIPVLEEGDFAVETRLLTGSGLNTTIEHCKKASKMLSEKFPDEVQKIVSKIGTAEIPVDPMPIENADMMVVLSPPHQWKRARTFDELASKMQEELNKIPGISTSFQYPVQMRFNELIAGAKQDVVCKIFGENIDSLVKYAQQLSQIIQNIQGVEGVYEEPLYGRSQITIQYDREKMAMYHITVKDVNNVIQSAIAGNKVAKLYMNERRYDIVVRIDSSYWNTQDIENLLVPTQDGHQLIPLNKIARVQIQTGINQIQREDAKRRIIVGFNVRNRDVESVINELKDKLKGLHLPAGYYVQFGGSFENLQLAKEQLIITVPLSLILIFIILYFTFHSLSLSVLVYTTIPMSIIGGILFLFFRRMPFSISAGVGFIALFGIAVLNGIVLISEFDYLKKEYTSALRIIFIGIRKRLRPVIMTATVASLGFFPMFINTGIGANVQKPLATVVIGGLITSTLLTLFVIPTIYYYFILRLGDKRTHSLKILSSLFVFFMFLQNTNAQTIVDLNTCIESALKNNLQIKSQEIISEYQKELNKTAWSIPKTSFQFQYGQYNGIYHDNAFQISQMFLFPTYYTHQKRMLEAEWSVSELKKRLLIKDIQNTVSKLFYDISIVNQKIKLLHTIDSIYQKNIQLLELQYQKGNISALEKSILVNHSYQNSILFNNLLFEKQRMLILLQLLTNIKQIDDVINPNTLPVVNITMDTSYLNEHLTIKIIGKAYAIIIAGGFASLPLYFMIIGGK